MEGRKKKQKRSKRKERESGSGWEVALFCTFRETRDMNQPSLLSFFLYIINICVYKFCNKYCVTVSNMIIKIIYISLVKMVIV